jgi:hypothetical protein
MMSRRLFFIPLAWFAQACGQDDSTPVTPDASGGDAVTRDTAAPDSNAPEAATQDRAAPDSGTTDAAPDAPSEASDSGCPGS